VGSHDFGSRAARGSKRRRTCSGTGDNSGFSPATCSKGTDMSVAPPPINMPEVTWRS
jgi:hypothetical protein